MGKTDQIAHMIHCQPRQMLRVMQVLTLRREEKKQRLHKEQCIIFIFQNMMNGKLGKQRSIIN